MKFMISTTIAAAFVLVTNVSANSSGTGSCAPGVAAIGGTHLDFGPNSPSQRDGGIGTIFEGATLVEINGISLTADTPATFPANTDLTWTVTATRVPFKGIFVRVQAAADNAFTHTGVGSDLQNVALCDALPENVIGVNHNSATEKVASSGILNFSLEGSVTMDISLVYDNVLTAVSAFSSYPLIIGDVTPTAAPVSPVAPVPVPIAPTSTPTFVPTPTPFSGSPEPAPTDIPAPTPVEPPLDTPAPTKQGMKMDGKGGMKMDGKEGMKMGGKEGMKMGGKEGMKMGGKEGMKMGGKEGMKMGGKEGMKMDEKEGMKMSGKGDARRYLK